MTETPMGLQEFTIDRKTWLRGDIKMSLLLNGKGERCCVGFFGQQICHISDRAMRGYSYLRSVLRGIIDTQTMGEFRRNVDIVALNLIYTVNDDATINDKERERELTRLFTKIGYKPVFIN